MAVVIGKFARFFVKEKAITRNLRAAFPDLGESSLDVMRRKVYANFGRLIAEIVHIPSFASNRHGTIMEAEGALDYPLVQRGQAIYVSAHLGNWELLPILFKWQNLPLTIIYSPIGRRQIDSKLMTSRRKTGAVYVEKSGALRSCVAAMKRGESIALLVDQRVDSGIEVDFFGRRTLFTHMPARMALKFNCPIIFAKSVRVGTGHVQAFFNEPIWPGTERGKQAEEDLTRRLAKMTEDCIRQHPEQWFCSKRRWERHHPG
jgi:KDO2-lipid IV(A) lauroyltransferase